MLKIFMPAAVLPMAVLVLCSAHALANADCATGKRLTAAQIEELVAGKYACRRDGGGAIFSNEQHRGGSASPFGELWDYKLGPADPRDPSAKVGNYQVTDSGGTGARLVYVFGAGRRAPQNRPHN